MRLTILAVGAALALGGCASIGRATEYSSLLAHAHDYGDAIGWRVEFHPMRPTMLMEQMHYPSRRPDGAVALAAAERVLGETGCDAVAVEQLAAPWFEVTYTCPPGIDVRALAHEQREFIRGGAPIRLF